MLLIMALPGGEKRHLLGYHGSFPVLILMGVFTGMFVVPVQVIIQSRPPAEEKGRLVATMNLCTWIGIIVGAAIYFATERVLKLTGGPPNLTFAVTAMIMLPAAFFYRPHEEVLKKS